MSARIAIPLHLEQSALVLDQARALLALSRRLLAELEQYVAQYKGPR